MRETQILRLTVCRCIILSILLILFSPLSAHESRPVVIDILESEPGLYKSFLKIPASIPVTAGPTLAFPLVCHQVSQTIKVYDTDGYYSHHEYKCDQDLAGEVVKIVYPVVNPSLNSFIQARFLTGEVYSQILKPGEVEWKVPAREEFAMIAMQYFKSGVIHIFNGYDHLLFLICLVFIAGTTGRIVITVTGFTIAHSLTLILSTLNILNIPSAPVDAVIALSIVFLAHELLAGSNRSWTWRYPLIISLVFGLLHGLGFASILSDIGLPQTEILPALLFFNLGVEAGQLFFILCVSLLFLLAGKVPGSVLKVNTAFTLTRLAAYTAGSAGCFLLLTRLQTF